MNWPTLALAATAIVLSLAALGWQWYSFVFITGSRVSVRIRRALRGPGGVVSFPADAAGWHFDSVRDQGFTEPMYAIDVTNKGRGGTSVAGVELSFSDGGALNLTQQEPALPFQRHGEHGETWYVDAAPALAYAAAASHAWPEKARRMTVRGRVTLGSGKTRVSKNYLPAAP